MPARRTALVTNDDGIDSPGLVALAAAAVAAGLAVVVAAPARQSSGASAGIIATTRQSQTLIERRQLADLPSVEAYAVDAQPAYIVRAAVRGWLDPAPGRWASCRGTRRPTQIVTSIYRAGGCAVRRR